MKDINKTIDEKYPEMDYISKHVLYDRVVMLMKKDAYERQIENAWDWIKQSGYKDFVLENWGEFIPYKEKKPSLLPCGTVDRYKSWGYTPDFVKSSCNGSHCTYANTCKHINKSDRLDYLAEKAKCIPNRLTKDEHNELFKS